MLKFNDNFNEWFNEFNEKTASVKTGFPAQHEQNIYTQYNSTIHNKHIARNKQYNNKKVHDTIK